VRFGKPTVLPEVGAKTMNAHGWLRGNTESCETAAESCNDAGARVPRITCFKCVMHLYTENRPPKILF